MNSLLHLNPPHLTQEKNGQTFHSMNRSRKNSRLNKIPPIRFRKKPVIRKSKQANQRARPPKTTLLRMRVDGQVGEQRLFVMITSRRFHTQAAGAQLTYS